MAVTTDTVVSPTPARPAPATRPLGQPRPGGARGRGFRFAELPLAPAGIAGWSKRGLDLLLTVPLLVLLAPLAGLVALAVKLDSRGPVFIRQDRVGLHLQPFRMLKFRSMVAGADRMLQDVSHLNEARGGLFKVRDDPRLTRVGRLLRRTSIDELPQLLNVLSGEMSLVGPRPPFSWEVAADPIRQAERLRYRPGMTGLWQVSGRSLLGFEEMIRLDLRYTRTWSLASDLRLLLRTIPTVVSGRGAF